MDILTFTEWQARLGEVLDHVVNDRVPVLVTRGVEEAVVLISLANIKDGDPTDHLLARPANAARLSEAIAQLRSADDPEAG